MAKFRDLKPSLTALAKFSEDNKIANLFITTIEENYPEIFRRVQAPYQKQEYIVQIVNIWYNANQMQSTDEVRQLEGRMNQILHEWTEIAMREKQTCFSKAAILKLKEEIPSLTEMVAMYLYTSGDTFDVALERIKRVMERKLQTSNLFSIKEDIVPLIPAEWPALAEGENFLHAEQVPYLKEIVELAKAKGYSTENLLTAWAKIMGMKSKRAPYPVSEDVEVAEALYALFYEPSYYETKKHFPSFVDFANDRI